MTQQEICQKLLPSIQKSPIYTKSGVFKYRIPGERISTIVDGNLETSNFAPCTTKVVMVGPKNEEYLVDTDKFSSKYTVITVAPEDGSGYGTASANGKIHAIQVVSENFIPSFIAAWGEQMNVTLGGFYACPVGGNEVYFIDEEVFYATYSV